MKKIIKTLVLLFIFLIPTAVLFAGCGGGDLDDGDVMGFIVTPKSSALVVNEYEINLEHGYSYTINKDSFTYYAEYASGKKQIKDTSNISFSTTFPSGEVAPLGDYDLFISYDDYSFYYIIKVNKVVEKPVASQTSFTYNGDVQSPEIIGLQNEYMEQCGSSTGAEAFSDYFYMYGLKDNCMWSDGSTEACFVSWEIKPYEIPTPIYQTVTYDPHNSWRYPAEYLENADDYEDIPNFSLERYNHIIDFGEDITSVGTHTIQCEIESPNYCFAGGAKSVSGQFTVNVLYIEIPDYIKQYTYSNGGHNLQFVGDWPAHVSAMEEDYYQNEIGTHYSTFEVANPGNVLWAGIEDVEDGENVNEYVIKVSNSRIRLKWEIVPIRIEKPTLVAEEVLFDYSFHPAISYKSAEGMVISYNGGHGGDSAYDAGKYTVDISLEYGYAWKGSGTETVHYDWEILKRELSEPDSNTHFEEWKNPYHVYAKNTFSIEDIFLSFEFDFSTYSKDEEMPIYTGEPIAWETVAEGSYKFVDSDGIIWLKKVVGDKTTISQSFDLSGKELGDTQVAYATYYSPNKNFFDEKSIKFDIGIAQKGSQWFDFEWEDPDNPDISRIYGEVFQFDEDNIVVRSGEGYKLKYKFINEDDSGKDFTYYHNSTDTWVDAGLYTVSFELEESADYAECSLFVCYNFNFSQKVLTAENITELSASTIHWLDRLQDSLFAGKVMHDGRVVEGTFAWEDPYCKPTIEDSNVTSFDYTFTPTSANYTTYQSAITLIVDRAIVTVDTFPEIGRATGEDYFFEGDIWEDMILYPNNACVRDKANKVVDGTWELVVPDGKTVVDDDFRLQFIPNDQTSYQDCIFEDLYGKLASYYKIKDIYYQSNENPEFILYFGDRHYYHATTATVTYTNMTDDLDYKYNFEEFAINKVDDETYTLSFLKHSSSTAFSYSDFITVETKDDLYGYLLYNNGVPVDPTAILVLNDDMDINGDTLGTATACLDMCRMLIPEEKVVNFKSSVYLHNDSDKEDIFAENAVIHDLAHTFYNFGELSFGSVNGNMELRNYGKTSITYYALDYLSMYNAKNGVVNIVSCVDFGQEIKYKSFGNFENHGTFNYIYHLIPGGNALKDSVNEEELYRFKIAKDSINTGTLTGLFEIGTADIFLNSGSIMKPMTEVY